MKNLPKERMTIDPEIIKAKLERLHELLRRIECMDFSRGELIDNYDVQDRLVFRLQQGVEIAIEKEIYTFLKKNT